MNFASYSFNWTVHRLCTWGKVGKVCGAFSHAGEMSENIFCEKKCYPILVNTQIQMMQLSDFAIDMVVLKFIWRSRGKGMRSSTCYQIPTTSWTLALHANWEVAESTTSRGSAAIKGPILLFLLTGLQGSPTCVWLFSSWTSTQVMLFPYVWKCLIILQN